MTKTRRETEGGEKEEKVFEKEKRGQRVDVDVIVNDIAKVKT